MKKNAMLKIAAILLVAVLLTTCAISSTFAKYSTTKADLGESNTARVAEWGVEVNTTFTAASALFKAEYGTTASKKHVKTVETDTFLVAPGTSNSITMTSVAKGTPEVSGKIVVTPYVTLGDGWVKNTGGDFYCPLKFNGTSIPPTATTTPFALTPFEAEFDANTDLSTVNFDSATLSWAWALGEASADDTYIGDYTFEDATVQITFSVSIEQTGPAVAGN